MSRVEENDNKPSNRRGSLERTVCDCEDFFSVESFNSELYLC